MASLDLEHSEPDWEAIDQQLQDADIMEEEKGKGMYQSPQRPSEEEPLAIIVGPGPSQSMTVPSFHDPAEHVDIPDQYTDLEETPLPSPILPAPPSEPTHQSPPLVNSCPPTF